MDLKRNWKKDVYKRQDNYRLNFFMDVKPFKGFNYRLNTSVDNQTSEDGSYKDSQYPGGGGTAVLDESRTQNWLCLLYTSRCV